MEWRKKWNGRGFSLVELIVAIAILAIVGTIVVYFMGAGTRQYNKTGNSVKLQNEAQLAMDQIQEMLMDATDGISYYVNDTAVTQEGAEPSGLVKKRLVIYNKDVSTSAAGMSAEYQYSSLEVEWRNEDETLADGSLREKEQLLYTEYEYNKNPVSGELTKNASPKDGADHVLLAEYLKGFSVDISELDTKNLVKVKMTFEVGNQTFEANKRITVRNRVKVNEKDEDVFK